MAVTQIAVINESTVLTDKQVEAALPALQTQIRRDFAPAWGADADLVFVPRGGTPAPGAWWLAVLDDSDQADALGYHQLTAEGLPLGKVFAGSVAKSGGQWTVTASHELLEMLADPHIDLTVFVQDGDGPGRLYSYEVCDACETDDYAYQIDGVAVSDFVLPAWFEPFHAPGSTRFDFAGKIRRPFELLPGGYISVYDLGGKPGWQQVFAEKGDRARYGSRRERRKTGRKGWKASGTA